MIEKIILATPRGPCAGVDRALLVVESALQKYGNPIYVNHQIVHNSHVVKAFEKRGVIFGAPIETIPENSVFIFSAHGVSPAFRKIVEQKNFITIDATCPLVTKVHDEAKRYAKEQCDIFFIGHKGHPEVKGTSGVTEMTIIETVAEANALIPNESHNIACITQTTLSIDETKDILDILKKKFPNIKTPKGSDICYATQNRQNAVKKLAEKCDFVAVLGDKKSSNSNRLVDTSIRCGTSAKLIENPKDGNIYIPHNVKVLGVTSGASVPEYLVVEFINHFPNIPHEVLVTAEEKMEFILPKL